MGLWDALKDTWKEVTKEPPPSVRSIPSAVRDQLRLHGITWGVSGCTTAELTQAVYHLVRAVEELERQVAELKKQKQ